MKINGIFLSAILAVVLCINGNLSAATYGGGSGTLESPYLISTAEQMNTLGTDPNDWDNYFKLTADIDMSSYTGTQYNIIGNESTPFTGTFDGDGHKINHLTYNTTGAVDYVGLFGYTNSATLKNAGLENVNLSTGGRIAGALVGMQYDGTVTSCSSTGSVTNFSVAVAGGLVGYLASGAITNCTSTGAVTSSGTAGGLVGMQAIGTITHCTSTGAVSSSSAAGTEYSIAGGLVGWTNGTITHCFSSGTVTASSTTTSSMSFAGGLVGWQYGGTIIHCYNTGTVTSSVVANAAIAGGLVGNSEASISTCYSTGPVIAAGPIVYKGGLVGFANIAVTACFWDTQTSELTDGAGYPDPDPVGVTGKTTTQMKTLSTFIDAGWDFVLETINGTQDIWTLSAGQYPSLAWQGGTPPAAVTIPNVAGMPQADAQSAIAAVGLTVGTVTTAYHNTVAIGCVISQSPAAGQVVLLEAAKGVDMVVSLGGYYPGGDGTATDPYLIYTAEQMNTIGANPGDWTSCFKLMADIDMTGIAYNVIGNSTTQFIGTFDGNGHTLSNLTITAPTKDFIGLFGHVGSVGQIRNLGVENVNVIGRKEVGGLVGRNDSSITSCYSTGLVTGSEIVGGLVGFNEGSITSCYSTGSISGTSYDIGGLIGWNFGTITTCYSTGSVTGSEGVGGLAGSNYGAGTITTCYSTGSVTGAIYVGGLVGYNNSGTLTNCFWDKETSSQTTSAGGTGKTTSEMKTRSTFTSAGWDLVNVWAIGQHQTYPYLRTQPSADLNNDGIVNLEDFAILAENWLAGA
jgi:hypothetical protein